MMTIGQRAAVNTVLIVGMIAIIFAIATIWPPIFAYVMPAAHIAMFIGFIYGLSYLIEEGRRNKWK